MLRGPLDRAMHIARWVALSAVVGALSGLLSAAFIESLDWATRTRNTHDRLILLLPVAGLVIGLAYRHLGKGLERGSNLIIEQIHEHSEWIPFRLTPLIFVSSIVGHLFGASVGREGAALQLAAGVTDPMSRALKLNSVDRSLMLITAVAGGFGSVFGVPVAGAVFALEVHRAGRVRYEALVPAFTASFIGDAVVRGLGVHHTLFPGVPSFGWTTGLALRVVGFGVCAGLIAMLFVHLTHSIKRVMTSTIAWSPLRPFLGGIAVAALILAFGWQGYAGVSIPLALAAMHGAVGGQWLTKLVLTSMSIGTGFVGGEVIPLFVIGSLAGASWAHITGANVALFAVVGSVAVLAAAANTPLACTLMGIELFGGNGVVLFALVCAAAYATSGRTGIYHAQKVAVPKNGAAPSK